MALETATYINQLVPANPTPDDALSDGQKHLGLIKQVIQATFPNITGPVLAAQSDLPAGLATNLAAIVADYVSKTNVTATQKVASALGVAGLLNSTSGIMQEGNLLVPAGIIVMWAGAASAIPLGWALCNGSNGTPNLQDRFVIGAAHTYGVGATGGAAAATATTSSAGVHSHGGATASAGPFGMTGASDPQGAHSHFGATGAHQLTTNEMPSHAHATFTAAISVAGGGTLVSVFNGGTPITTTNQGGDGVHAHSIATDGLHSHNVNVSNVPAHAHSITSDGAHTHTVTASILPPYYALCFIMKLPITGGGGGAEAEYNTGTVYNGGAVFG